MASFCALNAPQRTNLRHAASYLPRIAEVASQPTAIAGELPSEAPQENLLETDSSETGILERSWQAAASQHSRESMRQRGDRQKSESTRQRNVLIIDDDDDNLLFAQYAVEYLGYRATSITSGQGAVAIAMTCLPDIILLDILLRNVSGIDVLHQLRQQESIAHVPVVAVTALARPCDHRNIMAAGFSDYLLKPYMIDELERMIGRHLPN